MSSKAYRPLALFLLCCRPGGYLQMMLRQITRTQHVLFLPGEQHWDAAFLNSCVEDACQQGWSGHITTRQRAQRHLRVEGVHRQRLMLHMLSAAGTCPYKEMSEQAIKHESSKDESTTLSLRADDHVTSRDEITDHISQRLSLMVQKMELD